MKLPRLAPRPRSLACAALFFPLAAYAAAQSPESARTQRGGVAVVTQATPQPKPSATPTKPNSAAATAAQPPAKTPQTLAPREARARAYAKLLEGQRYVSRAKNTGGITREQLAATQEAFRQAAQLDPTLAEAHTALAELAFFFLDDTDQAEREAKAAVAADADNFGAHRILSRLYSLRAGLDESKLKRDDAERAVSELKEVLRLDGNDAEALALIGEFYHLTGREADAIEAFKKWVGAPATVDTRFYQVITQGGELSSDAALARLAEAYLEAGRTAEAMTLIRQALAAAPDNQQYLALLEEAVEKGGDATAALDELKRVAAANPTDSAATMTLARAQARAGKTDDAVATLRAAVARDAKDAKQQEALTDALAATLADALRYDEAVAAYDELLKSRGINDAPLVADTDKQLASKYLERIVVIRRQAEQTDAAAATVARMRRLLGANDLLPEYYAVQLLRDAGKRTEAVEAAHAARTRFPENPALLNLEAATLAEAGRVDEAATLLRTRLNGKIDNDYTVNASIVQLYIEANRGREAVDLAQKLLASTPADAPALMKQNSLVLLSSAQERAGDFKGAEDSLRKILADDPDNATALNNLGYFLTERGERLKEALDMIQRAVKSDPSNASFLDSLGWVYFKLGQLDEAERYLSDAAKLGTRSATIQEHLGDLYERRGKREEARAAWRKALSFSTEAGETARLKSKINGDTRR
ncbi:MAG: tetratricopeptide repeat protein [Pyrinomonadaceae bacterium]